MITASAQAAGTKLGLARKMFRVRPEATPFRAFAAGFLFGPAGVGIYLRSWPDFLILLIPILLIFFVGIEVSGPGIWAGCGAYGAMRVMYSRKRAGELPAERSQVVQAKSIEPGEYLASVQSCVRTA